MYASFGATNNRCRHSRGTVRAPRLKQFSVRRVYRCREKQLRVVHAPFVWHRPAMTHDLDEDLENSIAFALAQFPYQPPRTRSTDERRSYFLSVARAVRKQLQFSWTFHKNPPQRVVPSDWEPHPDADR